MDYKSILEANKDNADLLRELVRECNAWNGSLDSFEVYEFDDDFFDTYFNGTPEEAARAVFFGDIQNWMDDYIRYNGYGNLESLNGYQYDKELIDNADEIITEALENADNIDLKEIIENLGLEVTA